MSETGRAERAPAEPGPHRLGDLPPTGSGPVAAGPIFSEGSGPGALPAAEVALAEGMTFEGLLVLPKPARIDGRVTGEVLASGAVEVGASGVVEADLEVSDATVHGRVKGWIRAERSIALGSGAVVEGDLRAPRLSIAEGARVDGRCDCGAPLGRDGIAREDAVPGPDPGASAS